MNTLDEAKKNFEKFKKILEILEFSNEEAEKQTNELNNLITAAIWNRLAQDKKIDISNKTEEELRKFLDENFSQEEIKKIVEEESTKIFLEYFRSITEGVSEDKLNDIEKIWML